MSAYYDLDQEKNALAYAISGVEAFAESVIVLRPDFFEDTRHQRLFEAARYYYQQFGGALDKGGLQALLVQSETPEDKQIVYLSLLSEIKTRVVTKDQFKVALTVLKNMRFKRGLFDMINSAASHLQRGAVDEVRVCNDIVASVLSLQSQDVSSYREMSFKEDLARRQEEYRDRKLNPEKYRGVPYGIKRIDELTGGMFKDELILIIGRPGAGKSSALHNVAYHNAAIGNTALVFTVEMPKEQLGRRLDSRHLQISARGLRNAALSKEDENKFMAMGNTLSGFKGDVIVVDMPQSCSVSQMLPIVRRHRMKREIHLVVVDYLNLLEPSRWSNSKVERTTDVSRELKQLARMEHIPVITAARATRQAAEAKSDEVGTEHASWSDALGYDADQMIFLRKDKTINAVADEVEAVMIKFRDGSNERVMLGVDWDRSFMGDLEELLKGQQKGLAV